MYGPDKVRPYGTDPSEEHGTGFTIAGIPATFSVHTQEGRLPPGMYDVQIESMPPGDYVWSEVVSLPRFLELIEAMSARPLTEDSGR